VSNCEKMSFLVVDALNNQLILRNKPRRIVSLVPSVTYTLSFFGLDDEVVGITRFCKLPQTWRKSKTIIGGTKDLKIERIKALQPDLIIANKEENTKESVEVFYDIAPVYVSDVYDLESNNKFIKDLGILIQETAQAQQLINLINSKREILKKNLKKFRSIYMIWQEPWMTIGGDTFIHHMMASAGLQNLFANQNRYPTTTIEEIIDLEPDIVLLSSEPFPFKEKHKKSLQSYLPDTKILLVEGEAFTWFGAYPLIGLDYLLTLKQNLD